jgi:thioredoxin-dependent peroxiredoxin
MRMEQKGAVVIGVSADSMDKQAKFREKYKLNMPLLADTEKDVATRYDVYKEKSLYGKIGLGIERTTFIIGKDGLIKKIFAKVKVDGHVEEVLQSLDGLK